jgi:hypothetical protein
MKLLKQRTCCVLSAFSTQGKMSQLYSHAVSAETSFHRGAREKIVDWRNQKRRLKSSSEINTAEVERL